MAPAPESSSPRRERFSSHGFYRLSMHEMPHPQGVDFLAIAFIACEVRLALGGRGSHAIDACQNPSHQGRRSISCVQADLGC